MLLPGHATPQGTARYRDRFAARLPGNYRESDRLWISSIGLGTYLGNPTSEVDDHYCEAIVRAAELGANVFDTAVNYRHMRSERAIGRALETLIASGTLDRDEVVLATKGGFLSFDASSPQDASAYFHEKLIAPGLVRPDEVVAGCHVMSPRYLAHQIDVSRANLGVETIDIYYIHNPETQLQEISREEFLRRLKAAFGALEQAVADNKIRVYGTATWNGYRVAPESDEAISLADVLRAAEEAGGSDHHFRAAQLPFNIAMPEALTASTQTVDGRRVPFLQAARESRLMVFASASLLQSRLTQGLPAEIAERLPGFKTDAQRSIQFVRSTPGITCALVGMSRRDHVQENLSTAAVPPLSLADYKKIFQR